MKRRGWTNRCMVNAPTCSRYRVRVTLLFLVLPLGACASWGAPGPVVADRPGYTDAPTALPARALQREAGVTDDRVAASIARPRSEYRSLGETLLRIGVGARTELRLFGNSYATRVTEGAPNVSGLEDIK